MNAPKAAVLSVGDELVLGATLDTNSRAVSDALRTAGLDVTEHRTVADDVIAIESALRGLASGHSVLVVTGGLGPTDDDLTRDALNLVVDAGAPQVEDPVARGDLEAWFAGRGRTMASINLRQSLRPRSARILRNLEGTAPGLAAVLGSCRTYCLPGPPREMLPILERDVLPEVRPAGAPPVASRAVPTFGIGESALAELLGERMARGREPAIGTTASGSIVTMRVIARGDSADARADAAAADCASAAAPYAFGTGDATLASALLEACRVAGRTLAVAESCTGGLVGGMLTAVAGSSDVFAGGWITYSNRMKVSQLGVPADLIDLHGAVSGDVARAMARGASRASGASLALSLTGIAGPGGAVPGKPVGTVWIAVHDQASGRTVARRFEFPGARDIVRDRAAKTALQLARWTLAGVDAPIIWERR